MTGPIYLDHNATTPVDDGVLEAMLPFFREHYGNPSSEHALGWAADEAVKQARERASRAVGATPRTLTFTSGATESISLAIRGACGIYGGRRHHIITAKTEHKAVLETCAAMEREGYEVTYLPVDGDGLVDLDALREALTEFTLMVAVMWANNETGVIQPIAEIAEIAHAEGALMMTDATQAVGRIPVRVNDAGVDLLAYSGHKIYGPKGTGALYVRNRGPRVRLLPQLTGGSQEDGVRGGTVNVPGVVGLGAAAHLAVRRMTKDSAAQTVLRDRFEAALVDAVPGARVNAVGAERLPNTSSITFDGTRAAQLLPSLRGVLASTGAACQTRSTTPSHVLAAMGFSDDQAFSTVRFSLGRSTTEAEIDAAVQQVAEATRSVRHRLAA